MTSMNKHSADEVRGQFEAWMTDDGKCRSAVRRNASGEYILMTAAKDWNAWQAALSSPAVVALVEAVQTWCDLMPGLAGGPEFDQMRAALAPFTTGAGHE